VPEQLHELHLNSAAMQPPLIAFGGAHGST